MVGYLLMIGTDWAKLSWSTTMPYIGRASPKSMFHTRRALWLHHEKYRCACRNETVVVFTNCSAEVTTINVILFNPSRRFGPYEHFMETNSAAKQKGKSAVGKNGLLRLLPWRGHRHWYQTLICCPSLAGYRTLCSGPSGANPRIGQRYSALNGLQELYHFGTPKKPSTAGLFCFD